jgi:hypothetical protein
MFPNDQTRQGETIGQEEVWEAIRYLDPETADKRTEDNLVETVAVVALLLMVAAAWIVVWLRLRSL